MPGKDGKDGQRGPEGILSIANQLHNKLFITNIFFRFAWSDRTKR